jgi:hypothetical protein
MKVVNWVLSEELKILAGKSRGKYHLAGIRVGPGGRIILKWA